MNKSANIVDLWGVSQLVIFNKSSLLLSFQLATQMGKNSAVVGGHSAPNLLLF
jgi:hypothetical protein